MSRPGREWIGDEARDSSLDQVRSWVVWGEGPFPPAVLAACEEGNDIAEGIVRGEDTKWDALELAGRWVVVMQHTDESIVDEIVSDDPSIWGYAPYLAEGLDQEAVPRRPAMRGVLRNDVGPRRKVAQPRPS